MSYIPLHVYTGYSLLKSGLKIDQYLKQAKKFGLDVVGISDFQTFSGVPVVYHEAEKLGINIVVGEDLFIDQVLFSFYVLNETGYRNLLRLSLEVSKGTARVSTIHEYSKGLAVIISTQNDPLKQSLLKNESEFARKLAKLTNGFDVFYLGLEITNETNYAKTIRDFAAKYGYNVIAFPSIKYCKKEDAIVLEMMRCKETKEVLEYKSLLGNEYLKSNEEIESEYTAEEIENTRKLYSLIDFKFASPRGKMISWEKETGETADVTLEKVAKQCLIEKGKTDEKYAKRLDFELNTIKKMGYSDYFLIVHDYVKYARDNDIAVGPGRGSASGSLVSYALGITVPDPFQYDLLFERFLNPYRQTMPDIDVDFSDIHRENIFNYLREKYGFSRTARIFAVQKIGAKGALNDVGKIFNYEEHDIKLFTKLISEEKNDKLTLREIYKTSPKFKKLVDDDKYYLEIVALASKIEGLPSTASLHAVGLVLNADPLEDVIPLSIASDGGYVEQFEKDYIEEQGFLKMDILPITNLTIIDNCLALLKNKGINLSRDEIPYDDPEGIKLIGTGKTMGLFQIESVGMRNAIKALKIKKFEDVVQLLALYRPGPMDSINDFANKKNSGIKPKYLSPVLEEILAPTYGVIVYQEQIMKIANKMAGFSLAEADSFRRAVSKKDTEKLESLRSSFVDGAIKEGYAKEEATSVFNLIHKFADYGFNRSHSVVYAIFTCRMAYLKAHYPEEFYASILSNASSSEINNTLAEMKALKIKVVCPDINKAGVSYRLENKDIMFPLTSIKGISISTASDILTERNNGPFKDFFDFVIRMQKYRFTDAQLINLINAGAFDSMEPSRATLRNTTSAALWYASAMVDTEGAIVLDLDFLPKPTLKRVEDDLIDKLNREKDTLGFMISGSLLDAYEDKISAIKAIKLEQIENTSKTVKTVGIIKNVKKIINKKKEEQAFITVYDDTIEKEFTIFQNAIEKSSTALKKDNIVIIEGYYNENKDSFVVNAISNLED